ncbi:hypothetical protein HDU92_007618, partial [Lobulomyces angularis]
SILCPQVMPSCDTVRCASGFQCKVFPQTAFECAKADCVEVAPVCNIVQTKFDKKCCLAHTHDWTCKWTEATADKKGHCFCSTWDK